MIKTTEQENVLSPEGSGASCSGVDTAQKSFAQKPKKEETGLLRATFGMVEAVEKAQVDSSQINQLMRKMKNLTSTLSLLKQMIKPQNKKKWAILSAMF